MRWACTNVSACCVEKLSTSHPFEQTPIVPIQHFIMRNIRSYLPAGRRNVVRRGIVGSDHRVPLAEVSAELVTIIEVGLGIGDLRNVAADTHLAAQAFPVEWGLRVSDSLDQTWPGQLRVEPVDLSRVCTNTCAVSPYPSDSTSGSPRVRENSVQPDSHPRLQYSLALRRLRTTTRGA